MKTNEIRIIIQAKPQEVFEYTVNPNNTHKWISLVDKETINTKQIGLGTIYSNNFGSMEVTDYEKDKFFELSSIDNSYQCSYSYRQLEDNNTELTYFECMQDGSELEEPMNKKSFDLLKEILEEIN